MKKQLARLCLRWWMAVLLLLGITVPSYAIANNNPPIETLQNLEVTVKLNDKVGDLLLSGGESKTLKYTFTNNNSIPLTGLSFTNDVGGAEAFELVNDGSQTNTCNGVLTLHTTTRAYTTQSRLTGGTIPANSSCFYTVKLTNHHDPKNPYTSNDSDQIVIAPDTVTTTEGVSNKDSNRITVATQSGVSVQLLLNNNANQPLNLKQAPTTTANLIFFNYNANSIDNFDFDNTLPTLPDSQGALVIKSIQSNTCGGTINHQGNSFSLTQATLVGTSNNPYESFISKASCRISLEISYTHAGTYTWSIPSGKLASYQYNSVNQPLTIIDQALGVTTAFDSPVAYQGDSLILKLSLANYDSTDAITQIAITQDLTQIATGMRINSTELPTSTCNGSINAPANGTSINLSAISLAAKANCTLNIPIKLAANAQPIVSKLPLFQRPIGTITYTTAPNTSNSYPNILAKELVISSALNLTDLSFTPNVVGSQGQTRLTLSIKRDSINFNPLIPNSTSHINFNYPLPSGYAISATPDPYNTCGGTLNSTTGTTSLTLTEGTLPKVTDFRGALCTIAINIQTPVITDNQSETVLFSLPSNTADHTYFSATDDSQSANYSQLRLNSSYQPAATLEHRVSSVTIDKTFLPAEIKGGGKSRIRVAIANTAPSAMDLSKVTLTHVLPTGLKLHNDVAPSFTNAQGNADLEGCHLGDFSGTAGDKVITLSNANIKAQSTCYLEFNVTAYQAGTYTDSLAVGELKTFENISNANTSTAALTVSSGGLNVANGFSPTIVATGEASTLTIDIINTESSDYVGASPSFTTTLPTALILLEPASTTCSGATVEANTAGNAPVLTLIGGTFKANSACQITVKVTSTLPNTYSHLIGSNSLTSKVGSTNTEATSANLIIIERPTIAISKTKGVYKGIADEISITLINSNPVPITHIHFTSTFQYMKLATPLSIKSDCAGYSSTVVAGDDHITVENIYLPAHHQCEVRVAIIANQVGTWIQTLSGLYSDQNKISSEPSTLRLTVYKPLTFTQQFTPSTIKVGETSRLSFIITNPNDLEAYVDSGFTNLFPTVDKGIMKLAPNPNINSSCQNLSVFTHDNSRMAAADDIGIGIGRFFIPANHSCRINMDVIATANGTYINTTSPLEAVRQITPATTATLIVGDTNEPNSANTIQVHALLQGPYKNDLKLMSDDLRNLKLLPTTQPYNKAPFNYLGTEQMGSGILDTTGSQAVVDWVLIELRSSLTTSTLRKAALLLRDGTIVDATTRFSNLIVNVPEGNYYVAVYHRNHLSVMTANPVALNKSTSLVVDFTDINTPTYGSNGRIISTTTNKALMWAGDINSDNQIIINGPANDASTVLSAVLDTDLNGYSVFTGPSNDLNIMVGNILLHDNNKSFATNYVLTGSVPRP